MAPKPKEKPKASPSQPPPAIEDLFTSLKRHIERSEYEHAVKVADQVLSIAPGDEDALRCKVVALIKDDKIDDALSVIQSSHKIPIDFGFQKAYCLYRQNKLDDALSCLKKQEKDSATSLLEAQILYRLGKLDACVDIYQNLQKSKIETLEINLVASLVSAGRPSEVQRALESMRIKATSSFELAYNTACSLIENNKYGDAEQLLLAARRIGQETLTDDNFADDDIEIELAPISVQLAYVQQILGQKQEAVDSYTDTINRNLADESSLAVAVNNLVALKAPKDVSDSLRKFDRLKENDSQNFQLSHALDVKLSQKHKETIYANRVLLLLHANKMDQARELVAALPGLFPESVLPVLLQAAVFVRENKAAKAEELLGQYAEKFPEKSKVVLLARAQISASANRPLVAAESLSKIPEIQHMPATVATIVALKERAGDPNGAAAVFDSAIKWWSNAMTEDDNKLSVIMPEAASFKLRHGQEAEASLLYEEIVKTHKSIDSLVGLVTTLARVDVNKAETYEKQLKPLPGLKAVDVDNLEKTSGAKPVEGTSSTREEIHEEVKNKEKVKRKRKRKPRYPKGFDPANPGPPPDPERWLPKRERSSYRPKRKDKRSAQIRGAQGAVARDKHEAASSGSNPNQATGPGSKAPSQNAGADHSKPSSSKSSKKKKSRK
ncbi:PREDICTED: signal recognition particle subunit SRP72 isoform X2 [Tarenaya hassleriana]|uniref:signal recognition particle subunit SRP72 isoform X1 n=1 Tax=Tarenaya hassleriana TaxID=28532 RepID=UPI00053CA5DB|nr:PREDICTED: signal recognition particle subunit SRP72 isoform X1 [Tarenaya hassleriana]XP_010556175.1 PREDICTED: signal recognition particle subunit SRP72 isoform X2 [Tarenaya hassleriana]